MPLKPLIIYNPVAGKGSAYQHLPKVQELLHQKGFDHDLILTQGPGHALTLSRQAAEEGRDRVVAAGGDGTVNETINGLMQAHLKNGSGRPALGVVPVGRGNDFAFGAGVPTDVAQACETLAQGRRRKVDIGLISGGDYPQGRYFGNGVGLGFDAVVGFEADKIKWLHGAASYLVAVVKTIFLYARAPIYEVTYDDTTVTQPFLMVSVMNGRRMGGTFMMAPQSQPGDGVFDLCLAGQVSQIRILPLAVTFMQGKQAGHPAVKMARARRIRIRAVQGTIPAHADGETICKAGQALTIELIPTALDVIVQDGEVQS